MRQRRIFISSAHTILSPTVSSSHRIATSSDTNTLLKRIKLSLRLRQLGFDNCFVEDIKLYRESRDVDRTRQIESDLERLLSLTLRGNSDISPISRQGYRCCTSKENYGQLSDVLTQPHTYIHASVYTRIHMQIHRYKLRTHTYIYILTRDNVFYLREPKRKRKKKITDWEY